MRQIVLALASAIGLALGAGNAALAGPATYSYVHTQGGTTYDFGTMTLSYESATSLAVRFDAKNPAGATGFQVTGFIFSFLPDRPGLTVSNPVATAFNFDQDALNWLQFTGRDNQIPQPQGPIKKEDFEFRVSEGNASTMTPPGIRANQTDVFYLGGFTGLTASTDIASLVDMTGIRIQALPSSINGGSLFLLDTLTVARAQAEDVPEPATLALFGVGLAGLGVAMRRRRAGQAC